MAAARIVGAADSTWDLDLSIRRMKLDSATTTTNLGTDLSGSARRVERLAELERCILAAW